jgi:hypothetical protein
MSQRTQTPTGASAVTALSVAAMFAVNGRYIEAGVAGLIGVALMGAYHYLQMEDFKVDEETIEDISEEAGSAIEESKLRDKLR